MGNDKNRFNGYLTHRQTNQRVNLLQCDGNSRIYHKTHETPSVPKCAQNTCSYSHLGHALDYRSKRFHLKSVPPPLTIIVWLLPVLEGLYVRLSVRSIVCVYQRFVLIISFPSIAGRVWAVAWNTNECRSIILLHFHPSSVHRPLSTVPCPPWTTGALRRLSYAMYWFALWKISHSIHSFLHTHIACTRMRNECVCVCPYGFAISDHGCVERTPKNELDGLSGCDVLLYLTRVAHWKYNWLLAQF